MTDRETARQKRLREALRENLKRRKSQSRGRAASSQPTADAEPETSDPSEGDG